MFKIRFILIATTILSLSFSTRGQNAKLGVGAEIGFPSGNFSNVSSVGTGASVKAEFSIASEFIFTVNAGIINFFGRKNQLLNIRDLTYAPLKAGLKYQLSRTFYAEGQLGAAMPLNDGQKTLFAWSPGIGNLFELPGSNRLDLGIRYEGWTGKNESLTFLKRSSTKGFIGIRFAYVFGL